MRKYKTCHPWCGGHAEDWYHGPCAGWIWCTRCHCYERTTTSIPVNAGPIIFCETCSIELFANCQDPHFLVQQKLREWVRVSTAIKELLPQPIWEEVLEHLQ